MDVTWTESALNELASFWMKLTSTERNLIDQAVQDLDKLLSSQGDTAGESRKNLYERILTDPPLGARIRVYLEGRKLAIRVIQVWPIYKPAR